MKNKLLILLILLSCQVGNGQIFSIRPGKMVYNSKTIIPVIGQLEEINIKDYFSLHFDYYSLNKKLQLGLSYSHHRGWTDFTIDSAKWGGKFSGGPRWGGNGSSGVAVHRSALKIGYNILGEHRRLKLMPQIRIIFERAKATTGYGVRAYIDSEVDDHYEGPISLLPFHSFQVLPALGIDLDWNFWWRFHFVYSTYYAWGHKPFQRYYFEYTYDGVPQPTAEWYADGTGWFLSVGLGMRLWGYKKVREERKGNIIQKRRR